jgi:hypothetical protein
MTFVKFKPLAELKRLARGKKTKVDAQDLAIWALSRIEDDITDSSPRLTCAVADSVNLARASLQEHTFADY